jgi:hypothetical protein
MLLVRIASLENKIALRELNPGPFQVEIELLS